METTNESGDTQEFDEAIYRVAAEFQRYPFQFGNEHPVSAELYAVARSKISDERASARFRFDYANYKENDDEWQIERLSERSNDNDTIPDIEVRRVRSEVGFAGPPLNESNHNVRPGNISQTIKPYTFSVPESNKNRSEDATFRQTEDGRSSISKIDIVVFDEEEDGLILQSKAEGPGELFELPAPISVACEIKHSKNTASSALYGSSAAAEDVSRLSKLRTKGETDRVILLFDWWPLNGNRQWRYTKTNRFSEGYLGKLQENARKLGMENSVEIIYVPRHYRVNKGGDEEEITEAVSAAGGLFEYVCIDRPEVDDELENPCVIRYTIKPDSPSDG